MALLKDGKPMEIGGITDLIDLELKNGSITKVNCVFFNLDRKVQSTDFFLFLVKNGKLISHSIGKRTHPFFRELYQKVLSDPDKEGIDSFLDEFVGKYIEQGMMGNFPSN